MLADILKNRQNVVLLQKRTLEYKLYSLNKEEAEYFEALLKGEDEESKDFRAILPQLGLEIDMVGHVDDVVPVHVSNIIPKIHTHIRRKVDHYDKTEVTHEYVCYQEHSVPNKYNNLIKHEEKLSSFRCACDKLQTKYFLVIKTIYRGGIADQIENTEVYGDISYENIKKTVTDVLYGKQDGDTNRDTTTHTESPNIG